MLHINTPVFLSDKLPSFRSKEEAVEFLVDKMERAAVDVGIQYKGKKLFAQKIMGLSRAPWSELQSSVRMPLPQ
jgi:hypothetical protein